MHSKTPARSTRWRRLAPLAVVATVAAALAAPLSTGGAGAAPTPGCVVDINDIVGWWRGEDSLVAEIGPDAAGPSTFADGEVDRAVELDGTQIVEAPGVQTLPGEVTVEAWIQPIAGGASQSIVSRWGAGEFGFGQAYDLFLDTRGNLVWTTDDVSSRFPVYLSADVPQLFDGNFHHVAATWDASAMTIYVDGVQVASTRSQLAPLNEAPTTEVRLGSKAGGGSASLYNGVLDEVTIWERALDAAEIATIHSAGSAGKCVFLPVEQAKFVASTPAANEWYGYSAAVDGVTLAVGTAQDGDLAFFAGSVHVYNRVAFFWLEEAVIYASDASIVDQFGWSVALDGDTLVASAYGANTPAGVDSGAVYVFTRSGTTWTEQQKLVPASAGAGDGVGYQVAISGDTIVAGAPLDDDNGSESGSAFVWTRSGGTWTEQAQLTPADAAAGDRFGLSVGIDGDTVVVGSPSDDDDGSQSGSAYVFTRSGATWTEVAKLTAGDADAGDTLGFSVAVDGDTVIAGAPRSDDNGNESGSAYIFRDNGTAWAEEAKLTAGDASFGRNYGWSVSIEAESVAVGSPADNFGSGTGDAYIVTRSGTTWTEISQLTAADAAAEDRFGWATAIDGNTVVIGAYGNDDDGLNSGSAYVFAR